MKGFTKEIKIALVAIVGIVVLFFGMNFLKGVNLFSSGNTYYITFNNISGLSGSSPIKADGYKVGTVTDINYDFEHPGVIEVEVDIDKEFKIPNGTIAEISSDLLGNVQIDLVKGLPMEGYVQPMGKIEGRINGGALAQLKEMVPHVERLLPKIDSILTSVNYIMADPALPSTLHHAEQVTYDLTSTTKQINSLMATVNKEVPGLMGKAGGVLDHANNAMGSVVNVTDNLSGKISQLDLESTLNELHTTLANLKSFTETLNNSNGSLGLLMKDRSVYDNLNSTMAHADSLLVNLRENPKRYVHFSVFGKKDKKEK
ncbi:MAG: MCE family protein [Prevotella sp.]|nr:MCE family protein [Prevotella sp.]